MEVSGGRKLVYDLGANNGDDTEYYLLKGFDVVAVDADSDMCAHVSRRFSSAIEAGRLRVCNLGVSNAKRLDNFYANVADPAISTFHPEEFDKTTWASKAWIEKVIPVVPISYLVAIFGEPFFMKIDVEFEDVNVLYDLVKHNIRPNSISVEVQNIETFMALSKMGYRKYRIMQGDIIDKKFHAVKICDMDGNYHNFSFTKHSSGPFGDDFHDKWLSEREVYSYLVSNGCGWLDVHATI